MMYLFAAMFMTIVSMLFVDKSEYKLASLAGWVYYSNSPYSWAVCIAVMGVVNGFGCQIFRIVKAEKFLSPSTTYYAYLTQPIIAMVASCILLEQ